MRCENPERYEIVFFPPRIARRAGAGRLSAPPARGRAPSGTDRGRKEGMDRMRHIVMGVATLLLASQVAVAAELQTDEEKTLYALGAAISRNLTSFSLTPEELKIVEQGLADGVAGGDLKVDLQELGPKLQAFAADRATKAAAKEKEAGKGFLDKAAAEPGAIKLP